MNHFLHGVARAICETFELPAPVLEIGSFQVPGQEEIADLRALFPGKSYLGVDQRPGKGVDCVANVEELPQADASIGTVLAMNTFEHVPRFWRGFEEIHRVLRPDGAVLISCPFYFHIHGHPSDYWRFTPDALDFLLEKYPSRLIGWQGPRKRPVHLWALALREEAPPITPELFSLYRERISLHAHQPMHWWKRWRYRMAGMICGARPVGPYLELERWESICRTCVNA